MQSQYFSFRNECPACKSNILKDIYRKPYNEPPISKYLKIYSPHGGVDFQYLKHANYYLSECQECGVIFQKEIPNDFLMQIVYEKWIDPEKNFQEHLKSDDLFRYSRYAHEIATIIEYFKKVPAELKFFDFGMGWGKWALMAKGFGCQSYGTELNKAQIEYAKSNGINYITWEQIPNYSFDFINTEQVFEHISNPLETIIHLKQALKTNGLLKISVPTANDMHRRLSIMDWEAPKKTRNSLNGVAPLEHINFFPRKSIVNMAALAGLEEVMIPMSIQYMHASHWRGLKRVAMNTLLPIYRNVLKRQNYLLFKKRE